MAPQIYSPDSSKNWILSSIKTLLGRENKLLLQEQFVFTSLHMQTTNLNKVYLYHLVCTLFCSHHWKIAVKITAACFRNEIKPVRETSSRNHRFRKKITQWHFFSVLVC